MTRSHRTSASLLALAAALSVALSASAQTASPATAGHHGESMRQPMEARAKALRDVLNLRPDQEAAFQTFLAAVKPHEGDEPMMGGHRMDQGQEDERREGASALTTPERLDRMAARMARRQAEFHRRAEATRQFYAVLSPEQKRAFDALPRLRGHHDGWRRPGEGRGEHG